MFNVAFFNRKNVKKMLSNTFNEVVFYTYPKLHEGKETYISFMAFDHSVRRMKRKKIKLNHINGAVNRRKYASSLIKRLISKLEAGWSPWMEQDAAKSLTSISDAFDAYRTYQQKMLVDKVKKESTVNDYLWRLDNFYKYITSKSPISYIYQLDKQTISDYLDYIYIKKNNGPRSRNNYLTWINSFCGWLNEKGYLQNNPSIGISKMRVGTKRRDSLSSEDLRMLHDYLSTRNPYYLLACQLLYYTMIRPSELLQIRIKDIFISEMRIFVSGDISKNRKDGSVAINQILLKNILDLGILENSPKWFVFGTGFKPSSKKGNSHQFRDYWQDHVRKDLNFPTSFQFYSLKDSGIRDLANAEGIVIARDQARHGDISTTNVYIKESKFVHEEVKTFKGNL